MNKLFFTALALLGTCTAVAAEDYKGETPKSGGTYCLYNVGKKQFLGTEDGRLVLGGEKVKVTLEQIESATTPGFYRIMSGDTAWGAELWGTPSAKGGTFSEWRIEPVEGSTEEYAISSRNTEASASMYLYQNSVYNRIAAMPQMPGKEFEAAQWLLVDANTARDCHRRREDRRRRDRAEADSCQGRAQHRRSAGAHRQQHRRIAGGHIHRERQENAAEEVSCHTLYI